MNCWTPPEINEPTGAVGDWHHRCAELFEHEGRPAAVRYAIEKLTKQLLLREPIDAGALALCYSGTSTAGGHPSSVRLELRAVRAGGEPNYLYRLTSECSAPKRWEEELAVKAACERRFTHWCGQLRTVASERMWAPGGTMPLADVIGEATAAEEAAARVVEDPVPVAEVQCRVLDGLRAGLGFFTANKEGGSHLFFDGQVYRRNDYGDEPNLNQVYADDAAMVGCLRSFYDWEAQRDSWPHRKSELDVWNHILGQLRRR